jgi:protoporphyrinogen oxidase
VLIIGAGPAGLACAAELFQSGSHAVTIVERDPQVGGLAKTLSFREGDLEFRTDIGPHRFYSKNQYLYDLIEDLLEERWITVDRCTRQYIDGQFFDYPVDPLQVLRQIGLKQAFRFAADYVRSFWTYQIRKKPVDNFEAYLEAYFGRALAEFSMINYTEKIWGIPAAQIHTDWARQRISGLNLLAVLRKSLFPARQSGAKSLVHQFYYPETGTGLIYETLRARLEDHGVVVETETYPTRITHEDGRIERVELNRRGENLVIEPDFLAESIPIDELLRLLDPAPPDSLLTAAAGLRWRAQIYLFITLDKPSVTPDQWLYFPNKAVPFGRVSEMRNFSPAMSPAGKTSLLVELFVFTEDPLWQAAQEDVFARVQPYFIDMGFFSPQEVRQVYMLKRQNVYPVYDLGYKERIEQIYEYLDGFENLFFIGRPGRFKYTNQDHSLEMGILAGRSIRDGHRYNIGAIGEDDSYFESGPIYEKRV